MRHLIILSSLLLLVMSSCQKEKNQEVTIVKNCTGTYLRWDQKDYQVCNIHKVASFPDGTNAIATFKRIETCTDEAAEATICQMAYPSEGWIEVKKIAP